MDRVLKKYTTIPQNLYVERNADFQLKRIIEDMQRPGYVLVARQMGKTNLLFNAKRTMQNTKRLLAYIDLSNPFDTERDCYRNIINNIIEPNIDIFDEIENEIAKIRSKDLPPHSEYSRSLIQILNFIDGELVIILDEIDALKSVNYSDNIFAQIRSNYFSRTNFPVLERLTYVLSGVIEPTELIKDKNKSPFNIGEKIYLDDFSKEEHKRFIEKSQLSLNEDISNFIYEWTNGNPRITFDLCSEIENFIIENGSIDKMAIDQIIIRKYLTLYDIAPIDHIRELVKSNQEIRDSIIQILNNDNDISDSIKSKLYLYGIINSNFSSEVKIKNKILEETLNIEWINSIDKNSKRLLNYGLENIDSKNYEQAVNYLTEFIQNHEVNEKDFEIANYNLGFAFFSLRNYDKAIEYFSREYNNINVFRRNALSFKGMSFLSLGKIDEGKIILEEVSSKKENDNAYRNATLNLASLFIDDNPDRALELFEELYTSTFNVQDDEKEDVLIHLRVLSLYNIAEINLKKNDRESAITRINSALEISDFKDLPFLIFYKLKLSSEDEYNLRSLLVRTIVDNKLSYEDDELNPLRFNSLSLTHYLSCLFNKDNNNLFKELLEFAKHNLLESPSDIGKLIYFTSSISKTPFDILEFLLKMKDSIDLDLNLWADIYADLSYYSSNNLSLFLEHFSNFIKYLEYTKIGKREIYIFAFAIKILYEQKDYYTALRYSKLIISKLKNNTTNTLEHDMIIVYYWKVNIHLALYEKDNAMQLAGETLKIIKKTPSEVSMLDEEGIRSIKNNLNAIISYNLFNG